MCRKAFRSLHSTTQTGLQTEHEHARSAAYSGHIGQFRGPPIFSVGAARFSKLPTLGTLTDAIDTVITHEFVVTC